MLGRPLSELQLKAESSQRDPVMSKLSLRHMTSLLLYTCPLSLKCILTETEYYFHCKVISTDLLEGGLNLHRYICTHSRATVDDKLMISLVVCQLQNHHSVQSQSHVSLLSLATHELYLRLALLEQNAVWHFILIQLNQRRNGNC